MFSGYNKQYLDEYERRAQTDLGRRIVQCRWDLVCEHGPAHGTLLDYGCGTGAFHTSAPPNYKTTGWDINPDSKFSLRPPYGKYNILTMWDVIEHLPAPLAPITNHRPDYVFIATPNAESVIGGFRQWKHFKPQEHLHYYTPATLMMSLASIGYEIMYLGYEEGALRDATNPRAIFTQVYRRQQA